MSLNNICKYASKWLVQTYIFLVYIYVSFSGVKALKETQTQMTQRSAFFFLFNQNQYFFSRLVADKIISLYLLMYLL